MVDVRLSELCEFQVETRNTIRLRVGKMSIKNTIIFMAGVWAYEEYARSQRIKGIQTPFAEIVDNLWAQLKESEDIDESDEEYKEVFRFLFEKEFRVFYDLLEDGENDMLERMETIFEEMGYEPQMRVIRE